jgi:hypothetical protein
MIYNASSSTVRILKVRPSKIKTDWINQSIQIIFLLDANGNGLD